MIKNNLGLSTTASGDAPGDKHRNADKRSSKRYDVQMIRNFLDQLEVEIRAQFVEYMRLLRLLDSNEEFEVALEAAADPVLTEFIEEYWRLYGCSLVKTNIIDGKNASDEELKRVTIAVAETYLQTRNEQLLRHLKPLEELFAEALACAQLRRDEDGNRIEPQHIVSVLEIVRERIGKKRKKRSAVQRDNGKTTTIRQESSKGYDLEMVGEFLHHLELEILAQRLEYVELLLSLDASVEFEVAVKARAGLDEESTEQLKKYRQLYGSSLVSANKIDGTNACDVALVQRNIEKRDEQIDHLDALRGLFDAAIACAKLPFGRDEYGNRIKPQHVISARVIVEESAKQRAAVQRVDSKTATIVQRSSKGYDVPMVRDFLSHLLLEIRTQHYECLKFLGALDANAEIEEAHKAAAEPAEKIIEEHRKYQQRYGSYLVTSNNIDGTNATDEEIKGVAKALLQVNIEKRDAQIGHLEALKELFDEAFTCAELPSGRLEDGSPIFPHRVWSVREIVDRERRVDPPV